MATAIKTRKKTGVNNWDNSVVVQRFESNSKPGKFYEVRKNWKTGNFSCNCPGWAFKKKGQERSCRHIKMLEI